MHVALTRCFLVLVLGTWTVLGSSCTTTSPDTAEAPLPVSKNWRQIAPDKAIYYPADYRPKGESEYNQGEWVYAGTASFYIPKEGTATASRDQLTSEALTLRKQYGGRPSAPAGRQQPMDLPTYKDFLALPRAIFMAPVVIMSPILEMGDPEAVKDSFGIMEKAIDGPQ